MSEIDDCDIAFEEARTAELIAAAHAKGRAEGIEEAAKALEEWDNECSYCFAGFRAAELIRSLTKQEQG